jgi:hypothetical protein
MDFMGFTINNITMLGLILAIGIVVDDAVVVHENIFRHMEEYGLSAREAASAVGGGASVAICRPRRTFHTPTRSSCAAKTSAMASLPLPAASFAMPRLVRSTPDLGTTLDLRITPIREGQTILAKALRTCGETRTFS